MLFFVKKIEHLIHNPSLVILTILLKKSKVQHIGHVFIVILICAYCPNVDKIRQNH